MRLKNNKVQPELVTSNRDSAMQMLHLDTKASELQATDGYRLARFPVELEDGDTSGPIPGDVLKLARKLGKSGVSIQAHPTMLKISKSGDEQAIVLPRPEEGEPFPDVEKLMPEPTSATFDVGINAAWLLSLAKAMGGERVRLSFRVTDGKLEPTRAITVYPLDQEGPVGCIMPIRLAR